MDTSTTPHISPDLEPETKAALTLRYIEDHKEVAYQYTLALASFFTIDLDVPEALQLARDIVTEPTNDIRNFEGEEADAASRALLYRFVWPY